MNQSFGTNCAAKQELRFNEGLAETQYTDESEETCRYSRNTDVEIYAAQPLRVPDRIWKTFKTPTAMILTFR